MPPRTNGLYRHFSSNTSISWTRFTSDGLAFAASTSPGCAAQIAAWLRPGVGKWIPQGIWTMEDDAAVFTLAYEIDTAPQRLAARLHERARSTDEWSTMTVSCDIESSDHNLNGKSWTFEYTFVPLEQRYLDGLVSAASFRAFSSVAALAKSGVTEDAISEIRRNKDATLARLSALERDELVALGLSPATADSVVAARFKPPSESPRKASTR